MKAALFLLASSLAIAQTGSVQGSVTNAITKEPLRKAYVHLDGTKRYPAVTDDQGNFSIDQVEPGSYTLEAEHQGFIDGELTNTFGSPFQLKLAPGDSLTGLEVKLTPQGVISGRVVDEDGDPWPRAYVTLLRSVWKKGRRQLVNTEGSKDVDDQGEFRIAELKPGLYYLIVEPDLNWETQNTRKGPNALEPHQPTWYLSSPDRSGASSVTVGPGDQLSGLVIRLRRGSQHRVSGTLPNLSSIPALGSGLFSGPFIGANNPDGEGGIGRNGAIRPDGSFEISAVPPGGYEIAVSGGFPPTLLGSAQIRVDDRDVENVAIQLTAPRAVKGVIQIAETGGIQPSGIRVALEPLGGGGEPDARSNADGTFEIPPVGIGRYRVLVSVAGYYLKQIRLGDTISTDGTIALPAEGNLTLLLSARGAHLSGTLKRAADAPADPAFPPQVVLLPKDADAPELAIFDQTGSFSFKDSIAPGDYQLYAFEGVPDGAWEDTAFMKEVSSSGVDIHLAEGESKNAEVSLLPHADLVPILRKLGME